MVAEWIETLREYKKANDIPNKVIALEMGTSEARVSQLLAKDREDMKASHLEHLAEALGFRLEMTKAAEAGRPFPGRPVRLLDAMPEPGERCLVLIDGNWCSAMRHRETGKLVATTPGGLRLIPRPEALWVSLPEVRR